MNVDKMDFLCSRYPELYGEKFYFEVGDGWNEIIQSMSADLFALVSDLPDNQQLRADHYVGEVKEKFGELRVCMNVRETDEITATIGKFMAASRVTCDVCGGVGQRRRSHGWVSTRCNVHEPEKS